MKRVFVLFVFVVIAVTGFSQQLPYYSQYMFNDFFINPAVAGSKSYNPAMLTYRNQWTSLNNSAGERISPVTATASFHTGIASNMGVGGVLFTDKTGPISRTGLQASYAYHLKTSDNTKLGFGISGMFYQHVLDETQLTTDIQNDPAILGEKKKFIVPDATFGMYFYSDRYFAGVSIPQMIQMKLDYSDAETEGVSKHVRHYFFHGGYNFTLSEDFDLEPSLLFKAIENAPVQIDINAKLSYQDFLWLGSSYRHQESVVVLLGIKKSNFLLGYSYDITLSNIRKYSSGSHEIVLGMYITKKSPRETEASMD